jgi:alkanesulfonate monooxygenase SsuD/methylene tetrahydromethanopterin reductase-like flavin-dependent oxidoreductase (luciferase family)
VSGTRVGIFPPVGQSAGRAGQLGATLGRIVDAGVDHVCVGDHVRFFVGAGLDGLITATSLLTLQAALPVYVGLYLLPLRHPVPVARQLASIAELAPGRLTFGVGIGGEDRHEIEICGVDPRTRGRRMDECLQILRALSDGKPVTFEGEFFSFQDALILPAPAPRIPVVVGGRSDAAVRRAARLGDGWLGIWVSPRRFATVVDQISEEAPQRAETRTASITRSTSGAVSAPHARLRASRSPRGCRPLPDAIRALRALLALREA